MLPRNTYARPSTSAITANTTSDAWLEGVMIACLIVIYSLITYRRDSTKKTTAKATEASFLGGAKPTSEEGNVEGSPSPVVVEESGEWVRDRADDGVLEFLPSASPIPSAEEDAESYRRKESSYRTRVRVDSGGGASESVGEEGRVGNIGFNECITPPSQTHSKSAKSTKNKKKTMTKTKNEMNFPWILFSPENLASASMGLLDGRNHEIDHDNDNETNNIERDPYQDSRLMRKMLLSGMPLEKQATLAEALTKMYLVASGDEGSGVGREGGGGGGGGGRRRGKSGGKKEVSNDFSELVWNHW